METCRKAPERREALRAEAAEPRSENMAEVILKNIKKVYPNSEPKKKNRDSGEKKHNLRRSGRERSFHVPHGGYWVE